MGGRNDRPLNLPSSHYYSKMKCMSTKRPLGVWIITIYYLLSVIWILLSLVAFFNGVILTSTETETQRAYLESFNSLHWIMIILLAILTISAVILLFLLRKKSILLFGVLLVADIGITIFEMLRTNWLEISGGISGLIGKIISWIILFVIILYARNLAKKQILY